MILHQKSDFANDSRLVKDLAAMYGPGMWPIRMKTSGFWIFLFIQRTHNVAFATQISAWTAVVPGGGKAATNRAGRSRRRMKDTAAGHAGLAHCGSWEKYV